MNQEQFLEADDRQLAELHMQEWIDDYKENEKMGRYTKDTGSGDFQQAPVGTHIARCIRIIDVGTQRSEYQGKPNIRNQIFVTWELCGEMMDTDDGPKPFIVSKFYTNSLSEKANLCHDLTQWRGKEFSPEELAKFDLQTILGAPCLLSVVAKDSTGKVMIGGVMKLPKGQTAPTPINKPYAFWLDAEPFDAERFESLSEGIKKIIMKSPEYDEAINGKKTRSQPPATGADDEDDDSIPF